MADKSIKISLKLVLWLASAVSASAWLVWYIGVAWGAVVLQTGQTKNGLREHRSIDRKEFMTIRDNQREMLKKLSNIQGELKGRRK